MKNPRSANLTRQTKNEHKHKLFSKFKNLNRKQKIILIVAILIILAILAFAFYSLLKKTEEAKPAKTPEIKTKEEKPAAKLPQKFYAKISGGEVASEADQNKPVLGVMIENSPNARPQSGLKDAEAVFEAIAEGGITRFLALYQQNRADLIGPVRSLRGYYIDWAGGFNASIAHVGGSGDALSRIRDGQHRDMDEFFNAGTFWRSRDRWAPHNVYTTTDNLAKLGAQKGWNASNFNGFEHKGDAKSASPNATQINISISGYLYNSAYQYNGDCNCYLRSQAGAPHLDREKGQISPKVVVAMKINNGLASDGYHSAYQTIASGAATIFQDGTATEVSWEKASENSQIIFKDAKGQTFKFNRGQIWIVAVGSYGGAVSYQ